MTRSRVAATVHRDGSQRRRVGQCSPAVRRAGRDRWRRVAEGVQPRRDALCVDDVERDRVERALLERRQGRAVVDGINDASQLVTLAAGAGVLPAANGTLAAKKIPAAVAGLDGKTLKANGIDIALKLPAGADNTALTAPNVRAMLESALRIAGASQPTPVAALAGATVSIVGGRLWIRTDPRTTNYKPGDVITLADGTATLASIGLDGAFPNVQEYALGVTADNRAQKKGVLGADGAGVDGIALVGDLSAKSGMYALENADLFNILCIPRAPELTSGELTALLGFAIPYCEQRRAMFIADIPTARRRLRPSRRSSRTTRCSSARTRRCTSRASQVPDPADGYRLQDDRQQRHGRRDLGEDRQRSRRVEGAGRDRRAAARRRRARVPDDRRRERRAQPARRSTACATSRSTARSCGARARCTAPTREASEWKYVPIRRLALMIEESLFRGTKWVVFEPNDEPLWAKIRQNVGAFMTTLFRQGAFQGSTPDKAFFVKCDGETTTAADRNLGVVNIEVGFAPLKPAEFVVLKIQQIPDVT